jgi:hypothetical protein
MESNWSPLRKISFRFFFSYFILYIFPYPLDSIPFKSQVDKISTQILGWYFDILNYVTVFWHWLIPTFAKTFLHLEKPITIFTNGSGDTTYDYVQGLTQMILSIIICIIWSVLDKNRKSYNTANYWFCVLLRYCLAGVMLSYGFEKAFHLQMPYPYLSRLVQPYGDSSPMGLAWTYVGQSKGFSAFIGWSEVICGLLLFFRKTTLVGALLTLVVMGNVFVVNLCYDIPVKLFSFNLELMALYLAFPYLKNMYQLFIKHQPGSISNYYQPYFTKKWFRVTLTCLKVLYVTSVVFSGVNDTLEQAKVYGDNAPRPPLYGIYNTELLIRGNDTIQPLTTDTTRWRQIIIQAPNYARIKLMNDTVRNYNFKIDTIKCEAVVYPVWDTTGKTYFTYKKDQGYLVLNGKSKNDPVNTIYMRLKRFDEKSFRLMSRGFHWINEYPYNR